MQLGIQHFDFIGELLNVPGFQLTRAFDLQDNFGYFFVDGF